MVQRNGQDNEDISRDADENPKDVEEREQDGSHQNAGWFLDIAATEAGLDACLGQFTRVGRDRRIHS